MLLLSFSKETYTHRCLNYKCGEKRIIVSYLILWVSGKKTDLNINTSSWKCFHRKEKKTYDFKAGMGNPQRRFGIIFFTPILPTDCIRTTNDQNGTKCMWRRVKPRRVISDTFSNLTKEHRMIQILHHLSVKSKETVFHKMHVMQPSSEVDWSHLQMFQL